MMFSAENQYAIVCIGVSKRLPSFRSLMLLFDGFVNLNLVNRLLIHINLLQSISRQKKWKIIMMVCVMMSRLKRKCRQEQYQILLT